MAQSIIVTQEMMQPRMLLASVSAFARFASEKALYRPDEISPNALRAARIAYYVEQVRKAVTGNTATTAAWIQTLCASVRKASTSSATLSRSFTSGSWR